MSQIEKTLLDFRTLKKNCLISFSGGQDSISFIILWINFWILKSNELSKLNGSGFVWCNHLWKEQDFFLLRHSYQIYFFFNQRFFFTILFSRNFKEQEARYSRYHCFYRILKYAHFSSLITVHTKTDNIETFFLHLFRGSGPIGLQNIRSYQIFLPNEYSKKFF